MGFPKIGSPFRKGYGSGFRVSGSRFRSNAQGLGFKSAKCT